MAYKKKLKPASQPMSDADHEADQVTFEVVDALGFNLFEVEGAIKGAASMNYSIGGFWDTASDWVVESDQLHNGVHSFFCRTKQDLWLYFIASNKGLWMVLFDGDRAKIKVGAIGEFKTKDVRQTLAKLKGSTSTSYAYDKDTGVWAPFDVMGTIGG